MNSTPAELHVGGAGAGSGLDTRLSRELDAYNVAASGIDDQREFTVKVEDSHGLVAGLSGWTWGTAAGVGMVWVREDKRRSGLGSRLLDAAERVARERGCQRLTVSSFSSKRLRSTSATASSSSHARKDCLRRARQTCTL